MMHEDTIPFLKSHALGRHGLGVLLVVLGVWLAACSPAAPAPPPAVIDIVQVSFTSAPTRTFTPAPTPTPTRPPPPTSTRVLASATPSPSATFVPEAWHVPGRRYYFPVQPPDMASYVDDHHDYPAADIFVPVGSIVVAVTDGVVDEARGVDPWDPATNRGEDRPGLFVSIVGYDGVRYHTSHFSEVEAGIVAGVRVRAGQVIGRSGRSGNARNTPPHVHFGISRPLGPGDWEVRRGEVWPYVYLKAWTAGQDRTPLLPVYPWFEGPLLLGYSAGGRPLAAYRLGQGPVVKTLLGGIHGGYEWNTTLLMSRTLAYLKTRPDAIPLTTTLYIIPLLNPDGAALGQDIVGRFNAHGVDLNRNWDVDWQAAAVHGSEPVDPGARPFSEPETRALSHFLVTRRVQALVSYHSQKGEIYGDAALGQLISQVTGYPYEPDGIGYPTSGDLQAWCAAHGIAAIDVELTDHDAIEWARNRHGLLAFLSRQPPAWTGSKAVPTPRYIE